MAEDDKNKDKHEGQGEPISPVEPAPVEKPSRKSKTPRVNQREINKGFDNKIEEIGESVKDLGSRIEGYDDKRESNNKDLAKKYGEVSGRYTGLIMNVHDFERKYGELGRDLNAQKFTSKHMGENMRKYVAKMFSGFEEDLKEAKRGIAENIESAEVRVVRQIEEKSEESENRDKALIQDVEKRFNEAKSEQDAINNNIGGKVDGIKGEDGVFNGGIYGNGGFYENLRRVDVQINGDSGIDKRVGNLETGKENKKSLTQKICGYVFGVGVAAALALASYNYMANRANKGGNESKTPQGLENRLNETDGRIKTIEYDVRNLEKKVESYKIEQDEASKNFNDSIDKLRQRIGGLEESMKKSGEEYNSRLGGIEDLMVEVVSGNKAVYSTILQKIDELEKEMREGKQEKPVGAPFPRFEEPKPEEKKSKVEWRVNPFFATRSGDASGYVTGGSLNVLTGNLAVDITLGRSVADFNGSSLSVREDNGAVLSRITDNSDWRQSSLREAESVGLGFFNRDKTRAFLLKASNEREEIKNKNVEDVMVEFPNNPEIPTTYVQSIVNTHTKANIKALTGDLGFFSDKTYGGFIGKLEDISVKTDVVANGVDIMDEEKTFTAGSIGGYVGGDNRGLGWRVLALKNIGGWVPSNQRTEGAAHVSLCRYLKDVPLSFGVGYGREGGENKARFAFSAGGNGSENILKVAEYNDLFSEGRLDEQRTLDLYDALLKEGGFGAYGEAGKGKYRIAAGFSAFDSRLKVAGGFEKELEARKALANVRLQLGEKVSAYAFGEKNNDNLGDDNIVGFGIEVKH